MIIGGKYNLDGFSNLIRPSRGARSVYFTNSVNKLAIYNAPREAKLTPFDPAERHSSCPIGAMGQKAQSCRQIAMYVDDREMNPPLWPIEPQVFLLL